jgi:hypothetical protein
LNIFAAPGAAKGITKLLTGQVEGPSGGVVSESDGKFLFYFHGYFSCLVF